MCVQHVSSITLLHKLNFGQGQKTDTENQTENNLCSKYVYEILLFSWRSWQ